MKLSRPPDLFVVGESGGKFPAYLQGQLKEGSRLLVAFTNPEAPFVIDPDNGCMVTFAGTHLEIPIEPADPLTVPWLALTAR